MSSEKDPTSEPTAPDSAPPIQAPQPAPVVLPPVEAWRDDTSNASQTIHVLVWLLALVGTLATAADYALATPGGAPQQAAMGAMSAAQVIMAYVFARAVDEIVWHPHRRWKAADRKP